MPSLSFAEALQNAKVLDSKKEWPELALMSEQICADYPAKAEGWLLNALANHRLGRHELALGSVNAGLDRSPESEWGLNLAISIYRALNRHVQCSDLVMRLVSLAAVKPEGFATAAEYFAEIGEWSQAEVYSARRQNALLRAGALPGSAAAVPERTRLTIVVQVFSRADRFNALIDSLEQAVGHEECNLVVCIDNAVNSTNPAKYSVPHAQLLSALERRTSSLIRSFRALTVSLNPVNLSTALTAARACDIGFACSDNVAFFEEDCVVAPGVLEWFKFGLSELERRERFWFVGGESPFFNSKGRPLLGEVRAQAEQIAKAREIGRSYIDEDYVPSTCFATTAHIWAQVRGVRGLPRGAEHITTFLREKKKKTLLPTVPFVKDVGMQDDLGYSVENLGKAGVKEEKAVYVMNEFVGGDFSFAQFDRAALYRATTDLDATSFHRVLA